MATNNSNNQTFTLVGDFKDNITPALRKLNSELTSLTNKFAKLQTKLRPISRDLAVMADAATRLTDAFKGQRSGVEASIRALGQYRKEAGKVVAANREMARSAQAAAGASPRMGRGGGGGGRGGMGGLAAAAGGVVAGEQLANMMTGAIFRGFQLGTRIMMKPFKYGASAIGERIQDEMSDIASAGGMFAVDRRDNMGVFKSFSEARQFQQDLNAKLAKSAASLPGETAEYVQQGKMLTDTMMLSFSKNKKAFMDFARELDAGVKTDKEALATVLQKFTEKAVLLGKGSGGSSMYGVPQILEMLVSQEKVNVKAFRRFSAYMSNPLLKNALEKAEPELKKTAANSAERLRLVQKVLDQAVPNEVVMAMQNSADGIYQAIKSAFLDPETGLFGLGRKIKLAVPRVDELGRYVNSLGQVVDSAAKAMKDDASIFDLLRDTVGGFILPITGLTEILPEIYDPLSKLGLDLVGFRNLAQNFYRSFNEYTKGFEDLSAQLDAQGFKKRGSMLRESAKARGALAAINNLLAEFGAIDEGKFQSTARLLKTVETKDLGGIAKKMFGDLFSSDFMKEVGNVIGTLIGNVLKATGDLMAGVSSVTEAGPFAKGLSEGFRKAQGAQGISLIFRSLFKVIGNALLTLFRSAPMEMSIVTALTAGLPILQGAITAGITRMFGMVATAGTSSGLASIAGWAGAIGPAFATLARVVPPVAAAFALMVFLGGGINNTLRQLNQVLQESWTSFSGAFSALGDVMTTLLGYVGDLGNAFLGLFGDTEESARKLDLLKVVLTPITAAFQALEMGLLGLNTLLTKVRSWLTNMFGTQEEKDAAYKASVDAEIKMRKAQGRQNAYNLSMRGPEVLKKAMNDAIFELQKSTVLKANRSAELREFVAAARTQLGIKPAATAPAAAPAKPGATPAPAPAAVQAPPTPQVMNQTVVPAVKAGTAATQTVNASVNAATAQAKATGATITKKQDDQKNLLTSINTKIADVATKQSTSLTYLKSIADNTAKTNATLTSGGLKVNFDIGGGLGSAKGGPPGAVDRFNPLAANFGLQVTSGFRPGDPGFHGANRARDYSNGTGPTPQMMAFARMMASTYGANLAELIYTPLGFGIKNGRPVGLDFWGPRVNAMHYNHVHVAFAQGLANPRFFSSAKEAASYERMMAPSGARISTVTANSSEPFANAPQLSQNITINGATDPQAVAEAVWDYTAKAVQQLQYSSYG